MVIHRRLLREDENEESDFTGDVVAEMDDGKIAPDIPANEVAPEVLPTTPIAHQPEHPGPPPIPPEGLPPGWTEEQWNHYGHQWLAQMSSQQ